MSFSGISIHKDREVLGAILRCSINSNLGLFERLNLHCTLEIVNSNQITNCHSTVQPESHRAFAPIRQSVSQASSLRESRIDQAQRLKDLIVQARKQLVIVVSSVALSMTSTPLTTLAPRQRVTS